MAQELRHGLPDQSTWLGFKPPAGEGVKAAAVFRM